MCVCADRGVCGGWTVETFVCLFQSIWRQARNLMYIQPSGLSCPKDFLRGVQSNRSGDMSVWPGRGQHWRQDFSVFCRALGQRQVCFFSLLFFFSAISSSHPPRICFVPVPGQPGQPGQLGLFSSGQVADSPGLWLCRCMPERLALTRVRSSLFSVIRFVCWGWNTAIEISQFFGPSSLSGLSWLLFSQILLFCLGVGKYISVSHLLLCTEQTIIENLDVVIYQFRI